MSYERVRAQREHTVIVREQRSLLLLFQVLKAADDGPVGLCEVRRLLLEDVFFDESDPLIELLLLQDRLLELLLQLLVLLDVGHGVLAVLAAVVVVVDVDVDVVDGDEIFAVGVNKRKQQQQAHSQTSLMTAITSVVIENGSYETRAGFSNDQLPQLVFSSLYSKDANGDIAVETHDPNSELLTILNDGLVYNWEALEANWRYVYSKLKVDPSELPLVITEEIWNNKRNRTKLCELAFEKLGVPVFAIVKTPLAVTYGVGRSTSLVVDIGAATTSVTPVVEGTVLYKGAIHTRFAGEWLNLHVRNYLQHESTAPALEDQFKGSESYKRWKTSQVLNDFKETTLSVSPYPIVSSQTEFNISPKTYELSPGERIQVGKEQVLLCEPLFIPQNYKPGGVEIPQDALGLTELILSSLKKLEVSNETYFALLTNVVITGGTSLIPGLEQRLLSDLARFLPQYNIQSYSNPNVFERSSAVWLGASTLANMNAFEAAYIARDEFLERGPEIVSEKFK